MMNSNATLKTLKAIKLARQALEILIAETPRDDEHAHGQIGPILVDMRSNEALIEWLWECNSKTMNLYDEMQDYIPPNSGSRI
ncbi:MAG TPA: hypothetical protein VM260_20720 [Pirellula sp.]|nr:hypothetical protein [Pirellula sp.]